MFSIGNFERSSQTYFFPTEGKIENLSVLLKQFSNVRERKTELFY
ncbi:hypothetical protein RV07_GL001057 [Enterococcus malodoratus]|nr:hypothetical protein RV07_GL001057 [Enterococcus malodoratus]